MLKEFDLHIDGTAVRVVSLSGFNDVDQLWNANVHKHSGFEFHYIHRGEVELYTGSRVTRLRENRFYLIAPQTYHRTKTLSDKLVKISFLFSVQENERSEFYRALMTDDNLFTFTANEQMTLMVKLLLNHLRTDGNERFLESVLTLMLLEMAESLRARNGSKKKEAVSSLSDVARKERVYSYIASHMDTASLQRLAETLCLSVRQTERFLKKELGETFRSILLKQRMEYARLLIEAQKYSLEEVAVLCGYNSYKGFYLSFVKYFGMSPRQSV